MRRLALLLITCVLFTTFALSLLLPGVMPSTLTGAPKSRLVSSDQIWNVTEGMGTGEDVFHSVIACSDGGYVATGTGYYQGRWSVLLMRLNENGEVVWRNFFQEFIWQTGREVVECQSGGFAVIGYTSSNSYDAVLLRTDEEGQLIWHQTYGEATSFEQGLALIECQSNGFAFAGVKQNASSQNVDFFLVRTDAEGTMLWNTTYGGGAPDICYSIVESPNQELYLAGSTESFGAGEEDVWIINTDENGVIIWNSTFGGLMSDMCYDIIRTGLGTYTFVGRTGNSTNMIADGFAISILGNGTFQWETTFGDVLSDIGYAVTECNDEGYAITGCTGPTGLTDLLLVRLTSEGELLWSKSYGGENGDEGRAVVQAANGDLIIVGLTNRAIDIGYASSFAFAMRVPDIGPGFIPPRAYGPPDFGLISIGCGLAILSLLSAYLMLVRSRREIKQGWVEPKRRVIKRAFLTPRFLHELSHILWGKIPCMKCSELNPRSNLRCTKCTSHLHVCLFCGQGIGKDDPVLFCPKCKVLAHSNHMLEWLTKRNYCPSCGHRFNRRKYPIGKIGR